jgi:hypothetical protein
MYPPQRGGAGGGNFESLINITSPLVPLFEGDSIQLLNITPAITNASANADSLMLSATSFS